MATIKIADVEAQVRLILLDTFEGAYRFEPAEVYTALEDAFKRIRSDRPESRYVNGLMRDLGWTSSMGAESDSTPNTAQMDDKWLAPAVYYTVHRMYLKDDPDTANANLADRYLAMYKEAVST